MRRSVLAVAGVVLPLVAGVAVSGPASAADEPVKIVIGWADPDHKAIRITWPADDKPNLVVGTSPGSGDRLREHVARAAADELVVPARWLYADENYRIAVWTRTSDTANTGDVLLGTSAEFDTTRMTFAELTSLRPAANGSLGVSWQLHRHPDGAADPLDIPVVFAARPAVTGAGGCGYQELSSVSGQQASATIATRSRPYLLQLRAASEWGPNDTPITEIDQFSVTATVPTSTTFGGTLQVRGNLQLFRPGGCTPSGPLPYRRDPAAAEVLLQARANASAPWVLVESLSSRADGTFATNVRSPGTRQYRVLAPADPGHFADPTTRYVAAFGSSTAATTTVTRYRLNSAKFLDPTVAPGKPVTITLGVAPANNVRATLQRWNGTAWTSLKWVYLSKGVGRYSFAAPGRGNTAYRFVVPPTTSAGLPVAGITTGTMTLSVR